MLKEYTSKPTTVLACRISENGELEKIKTGIYKYTEKGKGAIRTVLEFTKGAKQEEPQVGDFIIQTAKDDIYLCGHDKFEEEYNIKGLVIR